MDKVKTMDDVYNHFKNDNNTFIEYIQLIYQNMNKLNLFYNNNLIVTIYRSDIPCKGSLISFDGNLEYIVVNVNENENIYDAFLMTITSRKR